MGAEFQEAVGTDEWDVITYPDGYTDKRLGLFHCHPAVRKPNLFWVNNVDRCCRNCGKQAPDFVWFRYVTWKLKFLTL